MYCYKMQRIVKAYKQLISTILNLLNLNNVTKIVEDIYAFEKELAKVNWYLYDNLSQKASFKKYGINWSNRASCKTILHCRSKQQDQQNFWIGTKMTPWLLFEN